jgi:hypothetical protein
MATLYFQEIPDNLYQEVEQIAISYGYSLKSYILLLFQQVVEAEQLRLKRADTLATIRQRRAKRLVDTPDSVMLLREIRSQAV